MNSKSALLLLSGLVSFQASAETVWSKVIEADIQQIYTTVKDNHPGYLDKDNAYFKNWLEQGYQQALTSAKSAQSLNDAMTIIKTYSAGFADGHFSIGFDYQPKRLKWAGIKIQKYGKDYRVSFSDNSHNSSMPELMAKLVACDGQPVAEIMQNEVLKYRFNAPDLNFPKVWYAARILVDDGIGKRTRFDSCRFEQNGVMKDFELSWKSITHSDYKSKTITNNTARQFQFETIGDDQYWVTLPKFYPDQQEQKVLRQVLEQVKAVNTTAKQFVIDVRGNGGGNSQWGVQVAKAIYGDAYVEHYQLSHPDKSYPLWRVSPDNTKHLEKILPQILQQFGEDNSAYKSFATLTEDMKAALEQKILFVKQGSGDEDKANTAKTSASPVGSAQVLFLTDSSCGSACLDFADLILALPNVEHIGQETSADTVYMDIRIVDLPSGLGYYSLAQKVYRERQRKHNQSYIPKYFYNADISDTQKLKQWIQTLPIK